MTTPLDPAVWFPAVRTGTGTDVFTERLAVGLRNRGFRTEITWLPLRAEYLPWTVPVPRPPAWANVVHVNTWLHPRFLPDCLAVVATVHHSVHDARLQPYKGAARSAYHWRWIAPRERAMMRRANRVVAVSGFAADQARKTLLDVPVEVIYNGVDTNRFRPSDEARQPNKPFRLLYVGSWARRKGVDLLGSIMRELGDGFELLYTGGAAADCDRPNMPANTRDIGRLSSEDAVIAAMQSADLFLFPSRSEGFGLVAAEAMACSLPVVATCGSSLDEIVEDGEAGYLCAMDDTAAFADAVRRIADEPAVYARMVAKSRRQAVERFDESVMVEGYLELYHRLCSLKR